MKINKKKTVVIVIIAIVIFTATIIGIYWHNHPTHYLYEDRWIIEKNAYQIEQ